MLFILAAVTLTCFPVTVLYLAYYNRNRNQGAMSGRAYKAVLVVGSCIMILAWLAIIAYSGFGEGVTFASDLKVDRVSDGDLAKAPGGAEFVPHFLLVSALSGLGAAVVGMAVFFASWGLVRVKDAVSTWWANL